MATVHSENGFRFVIWPNDHRPPHVHAMKAGEEVLVTLEPVGVYEVRGMRPRDVVAAVRIVEAQRGRMLESWREIHGE